VDYRDGQVQIAGWAESSEQTPNDLVRSFERDGLNTVIVTNIRQDGMGTGVDVSGAQALADSTGCEVIASGGVGCLEDIRAVREAGLSGVVVGKALYDGQFTLKEALTC
jgi:phosphoribosylformimino-5-aminoimidazole carboxamide ribotide isomerase